MTDGQTGPGAAALLAGLDTGVVGLHREAEVLAVALSTGRHVVLEGPPGAGKSTLLRHLATHAQRDVEFVEGNAELTPGRLVGQYDPALVLEGGYRDDAFLEGPLVAALRTGAWLYVEELNRVPEETLNVLITVLAEGELHVPRLGHIPAAPGFWLVAAMNPFDAVGTARVSQAVADRMCRISIGYQDAEAEREITRRVTAADEALASLTVELSRATREHPDLRNGSSVRGAIDTALLAGGLAEIRGGQPGERPVLLDAALAGLTGRIAVQDGSSRTPEEIVTEIVDQVLAKQREPEDKPERDPESEDDDRGPPGGGDRSGEPSQQQGGGGGDGEGEEQEPPPERKPQRAPRTISRRELAARHDQFEQVSPEVGSLDVVEFEKLLDEDPDAAAEMLHNMARATDPRLRALAHQLGARIFLGMARAGRPVKTAINRLESGVRREVGDLDLERTLERAGGRPKTREDLVLQGWTGAPRNLVLCIDHSGSMHGKALAVAGVTGAAVALAAKRDGTCGVVAFAKKATTLQHHAQPRSPDELVGAVLTLESGGQTDISAALRAASAQLATTHGGRREVLLLSDCLATYGDDPTSALGGIERLHVLSSADEPEAVEAGRALAARGNGHYALIESAGAVSRRVREVLG